MTMIKSALARRRTQEHLMRERQEFLRADFKASCVTQWEHRTSIRIGRQDVLNRAKELEEKDTMRLQERREEIANLYEEEMREWKIKLEASQHVSQEEKMEQIRAKATKLLEKRAKEQEEFVKQCYDRQWRDGCDEMRTLNGKAVTEKMMYDRKLALEHRENMKTESREDARKNEEIHKRMKELEQKEIDERMLKQKKNAEMKVALDEQMKRLLLKNDAIRNERRKEEIEQLERWKKEDFELREKELQSIKKAHAHGEEVLKENLNRLQKREREKAVERYQDIVMLGYALDKEQQDILNELEQKQKGKNAAQEFVNFLRDQMIKEQEDMDRVDSIRNAEMEKIWEKRDQAQQEKDEGRKQLMNEVSASRLEQIRQKEMKLRQEKEELKQQVAKDMIELERQEEAEKKKVANKKTETVKNMMENKATTEIQAKLKAQEEQDKFLLQKQIMYAERKHQERIQKEAGQVQTYFPRKNGEL